MEKRVLIFTNHFDPEYFKINDIVDWIKHNGNKVTVVTGNPNYPKGKIYHGYSTFGSFEKKENLSVYRLPLIPRGKGSKLGLILNYLSYFKVSFLFTLFYLIPKKKFDVVLVHHTSPPFIFIPALLYKRIKKPQLYLWDLDMWPQTLEATGILKSKSVLKLLERIFKSFYKGFDLIYLGSKHFEKIAFKRVDSSLIKHFPNWADSIFEKAKLKGASISGKEKIIISYTGNIGESQDLESLVEAVSLIENRNFEIRLIGDGRNKKSLINLVSKKGLNDDIKFFDSVKPKELLNYFEESHFLYLSLKNTPLFEKTVPAKFQTYLAVGIPIIGYISGETNDLISKHNLGFSCKSNDVNQLVSILKNISTLKDKDYQEMRCNCKSIYAAKYHSKKRKNDIQNLIK